MEPQKQLSQAAELGLANWKLHGRHPTATAGSQKPPALNPKCMLSLEHLPGQREREFHQGWRHKIKQSIPDLQTHPPTQQSAPWEEEFHLLSSVALRKARRNPVNGREVLAMDKVVPALSHALLDCFY